jgi:FMN phosphatase YigB (HAD superfamily)
MSEPVRAVLFDVDGTLYYARPLRYRMLASLASSMALNPTSARRTWRCIQAFRMALEQTRKHDADDGDLAGLHLRRAAELAGTDPEVVRDIADEWLLRRPLRHLARCRRRGARRLLSRLRDRGLGVGFLSDYPVDAKLDALELSAPDDIRLCATDSEINAYKPSPRGFRRACELWGLPPASVLYVGDRPEIDATGAAAAGMRCAIVRRRAARAHNGSASEGVDFIHVTSFAELNSLLDRIA